MLSSPLIGFPIFFIISSVPASAPISAMYMPDSASRSRVSDL